MFPPNIALFEPQIKEIGAQLGLGNLEWFSKRDIEVIDKSFYWLVRKTDGSSFNHWNVLCNGIVYNKEGFLVSCPPMKLYDYYDKNSRVSLINCDLVQKLGGQVFSVCWPIKDIRFPLIHSDKKISSCDNTLFLEKKVSNLDFSDYKLIPDYTLTFHLYEDEVYLISGRSLRSLYEYDEFELDLSAKRIGTKRPIRYPCKTWQEILTHLREHNDYFLIRDRNTGERANIYLRTQKSQSIENNNYKDLLKHWLSGEHVHIMLHHPHTKEKYNIIDKEVSKVISKVKSEAQRWKVMNLGKPELADALDFWDEPKWSRKIIMMLQTSNVDRWENLIYGALRKLSSKNLMKILNLKD